MKKRNSRSGRKSSHQFFKTLNNFDLKEKRDYGKFKRLRKANEQLKFDHERVMSSLAKVNFHYFKISYFILIKGKQTIGGGSCLFKKRM